MTDANRRPDAGTARLSESEVRRLLHELQIHQAELAQQNEELRAARAETEDQLARHVALFEFAPVALATLDIRGSVQELNRRARELLGPGARAGRPLADLVAPGSRRILLRVLAGTAAGEAGEPEILLPASRAGGAPRRAEVQVCRPHENADDLLVALVETTERHLGEQARLAQERAEAANREKSAFLSRVSHELRTPLNAVLGFAQALRCDPAVQRSPLVAERVGRIGEAGRHLQALVDEVLDLSQLEAGSLCLQAEDFDLVATLAEVVDRLKPLAAERQVHLHTAGGESAAPVHADRIRTRQVLMNLLGNAIKFNRPSGEVGVHVVQHLDEVAVAVFDDGAGLSAEQQAGLFASFDSAGAEHGSLPGGGLGLALSTQLMQAMQGRLEVRGVPGRGSVFSLALPRAKAAPATLWVTSAPPGSQVESGPLEVLYVEDNPVNVEVMAALLEERPRVRLIVAADGRSGLALARVRLPDLLLLDMQLNDMDGLEFLRMLHADPRTADLPCVAVSVNAMLSDVQAAVEAGMKAYLTKPLDARALLALIDRTRRRNAQP